MNKIVHCFFVGLLCISNIMLCMDKIGQHEWPEESNEGQLYGVKNHYKFNDSVHHDRRYDSFEGIKENFFNEHDITLQSTPLITQRSGTIDDAEMNIQQFCFFLPKVHIVEGEFVLSSNDEIVGLAIPLADGNTSNTKNHYRLHPFSRDNYGLIKEGCLRHVSMDGYCYFNGKTGDVFGPRSPINCCICYKVKVPSSILSNVQYDPVVDLPQDNKNKLTSFFTAHRLAIGRVFVCCLAFLCWYKLYPNGI